MAETVSTTSLQDSLPCRCLAVVHTKPLVEVMEVMRLSQPLPLQNPLCPSPLSSRTVVETQATVRPRIWSAWDILEPLHLPRAPTTIPSNRLQVLRISDLQERPELWLIQRSSTNFTYRERAIMRRSVLHLLAVQIPMEFEADDFDFGEFDQSEDFTTHLPQCCQ